MTANETKKVLAMLKAAYPHSFKDMTKEAATGTLNTWAVQFSKIPAFVVVIAINKIISSQNFAPSIAEVKEKISSLYWEAWHMLHEHKQGLRPLDEKALAGANEILKVVGPMRDRKLLEPTLSELLGGYDNYLSDGTETKQLT